MSRLHRVFQTFELEVLFPDDAVLTAVPWPRAAPLGRRPPEERAAVVALVTSPPHTGQFVDLDPRTLSATQSGLTRAGVAFYLEDEYRRSGRTYADQFQPANKYPIVQERGRDHVLLSGHHRAAAALLTGDPLRARLVSEDTTSDQTADGFAVTPSVFVGDAVPGVAHYRCEHRWAAEVWVNTRATAWFPAATRHDLHHLGYELGIDAPWVRHQLLYARTGRIKLVPGIEASR